MRQVSTEQLLHTLGPALSGQADLKQIAARQSSRYTRVGLILTTVVAMVCFFVNHWIAMVVVIAGVLGTLSFAGGPLIRAKQQIKTPVLKAIADQLGLRFQAEGFEPDGYAAAKPVLFPHINTEVFTDCFYGESARTTFAFYQAQLATATAHQGSTSTLNGHIYYIQRTQSVAGDFIVRSRRAPFNPRDPGARYQLLQLDDPAFDRMFEVFVTSNGDTRVVLPQFARDVLMQWEGAGSVFLLSTGSRLFAAMGGEDLMDHSLDEDISAEMNARKKIDEVQACLTKLDDLITAFS